MAPADDIDGVLQRLMVDLMFNLSGDEEIKAFGDCLMDVITGSATDNAHLSYLILPEVQNNRLVKAKLLAQVGKTGRLGQGTFAPEHPSLVGSKHGLMLKA